MKVVMLSAAPGSVDGFKVAMYESGQEYDLTGSSGARALAAAFVAAGFAEEVGATPSAEPSTEVERDLPPLAKSGRKPKAQ